MYCPKCQCEYAGWHGQCPLCQTDLLESQPDLPAPDPEQTAPIHHDQLLELLCARNGRLEVEFQATEIKTRRGRAFPHFGRGYAWVVEMRSLDPDLPLVLKTTQTGKDRDWSFPYRGFGFAWEQEMQADLGGQTLKLTATQVAREKKWEFPYQGYGYAWTVHMSGGCGPELQAEWHLSEAKKFRQRRFPFFGFGFAHPVRAILTLQLVT